MSIERKTLISRSEEETERFAAELAAQLPPGSLVLLNGDLGAGKTVFSRGFARGLGITEPVSSPTYTILQEYPLERGGYLYHLDLYRIDGESAALAFGVDEYLSDPDSYALVEWPERIAGILPEHGCVRLSIRHLSECERELTLESC